MVCFSQTADKAYHKSQYDLLENAYKRKSYSLLAQFFDNWQSAVKTNEADCKNDTIKEVFGLLQSFYETNQVKTKYIFIKPNKDIFVSLIKSFENLTADNYNNQVERQRKKSKRLLKADVRPSFNFKEKKIVFLTDEYYHDVIYPFISQYYFVENSSASGARSQSEIFNRINFLKDWLFIYHGPHWRLENSYPNIRNVIFDSDLKYAIIEYVYCCFVDSVLYEKQDGKWIEERKVRGGIM
jgi:hypothetical protein